MILLILIHLGEQIKMEVWYCPLCRKGYVDFDLHCHVIHHMTALEFQEKYRQVYSIDVDLAINPSRR